MSRHPGIDVYPRASSVDWRSGESTARSLLVLPYCRWRTRTLASTRPVPIRRADRPPQMHGAKDVSVTTPSRITILALAASSSLGACGTAAAGTQTHEKSALEHRAAAVRRLRSLARTRRSTIWPRAQRLAARQ